MTPPPYSTSISKVARETTRPNDDLGSWFDMQASRADAEKNKDFFRESQEAPHVSGHSFEARMALTLSRSAMLDTVYVIYDNTDASWGRAIKNNKALHEALMEGFISGLSANLVRTLALHRFLSFHPPEEVSSKWLAELAPKPTLGSNTQPTEILLEIAERLRHLPREGKEKLLCELRHCISRLDSEACLVLERLNGFVEKIEDGTAYIRLTGENGDVFYGQCDTAQLLEKGVEERRRFVCTVREGLDGVQIDMEPVPLKPISEQRAKEIWAEVDEALDDFDDD